MSVTHNHFFPLSVESHSVQIGKYEIPTGEVISARVLENNTVRLWCRNGAMGSNGDIVLDFQLQNSNKVSQFVKGILEKTKAYLIAIADLKAQVQKQQPQSDTSYVHAEFKFHTSKDAFSFQKYITPVYFNSNDGIVWRDCKVTVFSTTGKEDEVVSQMKSVFAKLNVHTQNTLYDALSQYSESTPFYTFRPEPKKLYLANYIRAPDYTISPEKILVEQGRLRSCLTDEETRLQPYFAHAIDSPNYVITPDRVDVLMKKGWGHKMKPLIYNDDSMEQAVALVRQANEALRQLAETNSLLNERIQRIFELFQSILKPNSLNEVQMVVFFNRLNNLELNLKDLDPKVQQAFQHAMSVLYKNVNESKIKKS